MEHTRECASFFIIIFLPQKNIVVFEYLLPFIQNAFSSETFIDQNKL